MHVAHDAEESENLFRVDPFSVEKGKPSRVCSFLSARLSTQWLIRSQSAYQRSFTIRCSQSANSSWAPMGARKPKDA